MGDFHSLNSPSSFARRIACPGSANAERGKPNGSSVFAAEGTAAHELAEICLGKGADPLSFLGTTINSFEVTEEMVEAVDVYVDYCRDLMISKTCVVQAIEERLPLDFLGEGQSGTADFIAIVDDVLHVVDYKHGKGIAVEAKENVQGLCYALGAAKKYHNHPWSKLSITIVQPRAPHSDGPIRTWTIDRDDATDRMFEFVLAAEATKDEEAPRFVGDHCRFCKAKPTCPAQLTSAKKITGLQFSDTTRSIKSISDQELAAIYLIDIPVIQNWCTSVNEYLRERAQAGENLEGLKLVAGRSNRSWVDEDTAETVLRRDFKLSKTQMFKSEFKSVPQIEEVIGKAKMSKLTDHVKKGTSGVSLVSEGDKRPAVVPTGTAQFGDTT